MEKFNEFLTLEEIEALYAEDELPDFCLLLNGTREDLGLE